MEKRTLWYDAAGNIYHAIVLITLAGIANSIIEIGGKVDNLVSMTNFFGGRGAVDLFSFDTWDLYGLMAVLLIVAGYCMYLGGLKGFAKLQVGEDASNVMRIRRGTIWALVALLVDYIPIIGGSTALIFNIVSFFVMIGGYNGLKKSLTFPEKARRGAHLLFASMILGAIGSLLAFVPILGAVFDGVIHIIVLFMGLLGWARIRKATPLSDKGCSQVTYVAFKEVPGATSVIAGVIFAYLVPSILFKLGSADYIMMKCPFSSEQCSLYSYLFIQIFTIVGIMMIANGICNLKKNNDSYAAPLKRFLRATYIWLCTVGLFWWWYYSNGFGVEMLEIMPNSAIGYYVSFIIAVFYLNSLFLFYGMTRKNRMMKVGLKFLIGAYGLKMVSVILNSFFYIKLGAGTNNEIVANLGALLHAFGDFVSVLFAILFIIGFRKLLSGIYYEEVIVDESEAVFTSDKA